MCAPSLDEKQACRTVDLRQFDQVRYKPFVRNGKLVEAVVKADARLLPVERLPTRTAPFPPIDMSTLRIKLSRGGCYGDCPVYTVEIDGNGRVNWHGYYYTAMTGEQHSTISQEAVRQLVSRFEAANFFALDDKYKAVVTDNSEYELSFSTSGQGKVVTDYVGEAVGMPRVVKQLEDAVDAVAGTERWVTGTAETVELLKAKGFDFGSERAGELLVTATEHPSFLSALLAAGAGRAKGSAGERPLQKALVVATRGGHLDSAALLVVAGADPNGIDSNATARHCSNSCLIPRWRVS